MAADIKAGPGDIVELRPGDRAWQQDPIRLRITAIRHDLSRYYDDHVWIEGNQLNFDGEPVRWTQELVTISALNRQQSHRDG